MKTVQDFLDGQVLLVDKPLEWTSFQVVNKVRWHIRQAFNLKKIKVGHAGTLDPLATGLLVICTGKMTKQIFSATAVFDRHKGASASICYHMLRYASICMPACASICRHMYASIC